MDHLVYTDEKAEELKGLLAGKKTMIVRGATRLPLAHDRVQPEDRLFFVHGDGLVTACSAVSLVHCSEELKGSQARRLLQANQAKLDLTLEQLQRWCGKRYLLLIELRDVRLIEPFHTGWLPYGNMEDGL
ncbi:MAG TPA: hypothetical protein VK897_18025 [Anaerolineales bacterium]|nr:hypothetical protein [Anaerolineales bacterium]